MRGRSAIALALALALASCSSSGGRILVVVDSDIATLARIEVDVQGAAGDLTSPDGGFDVSGGRRIGGDLSSDRIPISFVVAPSGPASTTFSIVVHGYDASGAATVTRARAGFPPSGTRVLPLFLYSRCTGETCPESTTCDATGACVPVVLTPPESLHAVDDPGGELVDAGTAVDAGSDSARYDAGACVGGQPDLSPFGAAYAIIASRDGTLYFSIDSGSASVARLLPGGTPEPTWLTIPSEDSSAGLALDATNGTLFVAGSRTMQIYAVALAHTPPVATPLGPTLPRQHPTALVMGPDAHLYAAVDGQVLRIDATTGAATDVLTSAFGTPFGLAFEDDGSLLVSRYGAGGNLVRVTLVGGLETGRVEVWHDPGGQLPGGLAVDSTGRLLLAINSISALVDLYPDGGVESTLPLSVTSARFVEFGTGAPGCNDVYISGSAAQRIFWPFPGRSVPWH